MNILLKYVKIFNGDRLKEVVELTKRFLQVVSVIDGTHIPIIQLQ